MKRSCIKLIILKLLFVMIGVLFILPYSYCHELNDTHEYFEQDNKELLSKKEDTASKEEDADNNELCYVIGCGDVLDVFVWQHPDLNREVIVRPDGKTSFPIAGEIQASNLTSGELSESLRQKLSYFIRNPHVTVTVRNSNSKKVFVLGEVNRPGVYLFTGEMTILEALSMAGGYTDDATLKSVILIRGHWKDKPYAMRVNLSRVLRKGYLKQNIILQPGDIIFLPKSFIAKVDTFVDQFFTRTNPAVRYYLDLDDPTNR